MSIHTLIRPLVQFLDLSLLLLLASGQVAASRAAAPVDYPSQSLSGEEALRFLQEEGLYEAIAEGLPPAGRPFFQTARATASDGAAGDRFGWSVALDGDTAIVGAGDADLDANAGQGAAYIFIRDGDAWTEQTKLTASDGAQFDFFGNAVALAGDTALVGAFAADPSGNEDRGAAYIFVRTGTTWTEQTKLIVADGAALDSFGVSVALEGETALVGAVGAKVGSNVGQGAAYVFIREGTTWSEQEKLMADDGAAADYLGGAVALDGDTALLGAKGADVDGNADQGAAYLFVRVGTTWSEQDKLIAEDDAAGNNFGHSVALDGDTAAVGATGSANEGLAYVFVRNGTDWTGQARLTAPDEVDVDMFGESLALCGDTLIVSAPWSTIGSNAYQGAAYVFIRDGTSWSEQDKLVAADGALNDNFGTPVALDGNTALVGVQWADGYGKLNQGTAYFWNRSEVAWHEQPRLTASYGVAYDYLGTSVALDGDTALVGAYGVDMDGNASQGAAYVFVRDSATWTEQGKLIASDGAADDEFGTSVALDGDTALVGAPYANVNGKDNQGAVHVFIRNGTTWTEEDKLTAGDADGYFGYAVVLDGNTVLIGANGTDVGSNTHQGAAYVFIRSGMTWAEQDKLVASDGAAGDYFGESVALDGDTALIGAPDARVNSNAGQGAAYVFIRDGTSWTEQDKLTASDGAAYDNFGIAVALAGDVALVGADQARVGFKFTQGAAYVFVRNGTTWTEQDKLIASDGVAYDYFGGSVALDGETAVVGAPVADPGGNDAQGAAYVFVHTGTTWTQQTRLTASDGVAQENFGNSVALDGETALAGAYRAKVGNNAGQGAAYIYEREAPAEPIQGLAASNDSPTPLGQPTTLNASVTAGMNISYIWDFGDGEVGSGASVGHIYPAVGTYTAVVTATNNMSSQTATTLVTIVEGEAEAYSLHLPVLLKP